MSNHFFDKSPYVNYPSRISNSFVLHHHNKLLRNSLTETLKDEYNGRRTRICTSSVRVHTVYQSYWLTTACNY